jgi:hypothetical protein
MWRLIIILSIITLHGAYSAYAQGKLEVSEMKGGSVMTDHISGQSFGRELKWFVINDPSAPVWLENTGITTSQSGITISQYGAHYASRGILTAKARITEVVVDFMLFDIHGNHLRTLSRTESNGLAPGASLLLDRLGPWKPEANESKDYWASISFVARARTSDGNEWNSDTDGIMCEVKALRARLIFREPSVTKAGQ